MQKTTQKNTHKIKTAKTKTTKNNQRNLLQQKLNTKKTKKNTRPESVRHPRLGPRFTLRISISSLLQRIRQSSAPSFSQSPRKLLRQNNFPESLETEQTRGLGG